VPRFLVHHAGEGSRVFELLSGRPLSIGRAKSSSLILDNPSVSRLHAIVRSTPDGEWEIVDHASSNGVKVNGVPVKEAVLHPNDEVVVGEYRLRFFADSAARNVVTYGTAQLPSRFAQVLSEPAYSGSFLPVQPLGGIAAPDAERQMKLEERVRALEHENRLLTLLYRVARALGELESVEEVVERVLDLTLEIDGAERGYAMRLDAASIGRNDFAQAGYSFDPAIIRYRAGAKAAQGQNLPQLTISQSIIRQVMQAGMPLLITDAQADPRLAASQSVVAAGIQSAMCAPLGVKDRRFGLLYVDNLSRRGMFTVDDLNVFTVIAAQAGLTIDHLRTRAEGVAQSQPTLASE
jgi:FHA domain/GAF domain